MLEALLKTVHSACSSYTKELTVIGSFFALTVGFSNFAYNILGFSFFPLAEYTFQQFHVFCRILLHILVFSWALPIADWTVYAITAILSVFAPIRPWLPEFQLPSWWGDLALLSLVLNRVFQTTDLIVPRSERAEAELNTTQDMRKGISESEGLIGSTLHNFFHEINHRIWQSIDLIETLTLSIFKMFSGNLFFKSAIRRILISLASIIFMWGFIRLSGYIINLIFAWKFDAPIMRVRVRLFKFFIANALGAAFATAFFIFLSGWVERRH